ncbi:MAG: 2-oxo acid dehydrogenase subunit E2 [Chloroflexi bacterium]|nr:2-oxo acid dehydrogenase subunit E2 [Chloroflexota bacterium]
MAYEIVMPRLGWTMEEGVFLEWLMHDGDAVKIGDLLCQVEGDKAVNEIESFESGVLRIPPDAPPPGAKIKVGTLLGYIVAPGETAPFEKGGGSPATAAAPAPVATAAAPATTPQSAAPARSNAPTISPRARRIAGELGVAWEGLKGSGRTGRIVERDVRAASAAKPAAVPASGQLRISPLAQRRAAELGVDLQRLVAAQPGKRIEVADIEAAAAAQPTTDATGPLSGVRRIIAERMGTSAHTTAPVTLTTEADATELVRLRRAIADDLQGTNAATPTYNDLLAKIVSVALSEHPALNVSLIGDGLVQHAAVHVGLAVDTERGLLVPVVRDVQSKSVQAIAAESARLLEQVRAGKISPDDLRGGTFTITNLGMYEIDAFTPIINLPECAILGVGRIVARPVVVDEASETVAVRKMVALSLTFDHRLVDGGPAARFLQRIKQLVERPYAWLTR